MGLKVLVSGLFLGALILLTGDGHPAPVKPERGPPETLTLVAVGDILMHQDVKSAAAQDPEGFPDLWRDLVPLFRGADLAFGNLESPIAPSSGRPGVPFQFNAPASLPAALRASGFTVLSTANNHAFDQGSKGVRETLDRLRAEGLVAIGSGGDRPEAETLRIVERHGIKVAFLAFSDLFNLDLNRKATEPWVRALDLEPALQSIRAARQQADLVILSLHWGNEYQHLPTKRQRDLARALVAAGCDVILGHHPHVLQPVELLEAGGHKALVAYSLGNFISNQDRMYRADHFPIAGGDNRDGAALELRFERRSQPDGTTRVALERVEVEPLWTENNWSVPGVRREIRVIRVGVAEAQVRGDLDRLSDPVEGARIEPDTARRRKVILEKQEYLRTLILRRKRVAEVVGEAFVGR